MIVHKADCGAAPAPRFTLSRLARALDLWRQRRALRRLDDDALRDLGVTRAQAEAEASRSVWDAPGHWRS